MPILSCGGMRHDSAAALDAVVDRAMAFGVNHFETARMYMGGRSEKDFGRTLRRYPRESFILQTKVAPKSDPKKFRSELVSSMANLQTDYLDLFAFHGVNRATELDYVLRKGGCLEVARQLQKQGKIRHIGFSTHAPTPVILAAIESGAFDYVNLVRAHAFRANDSPLYLDPVPGETRCSVCCSDCAARDIMCSTTTSWDRTPALGLLRSVPSAAVVWMVCPSLTVATVLLSLLLALGAWVSLLSARLTKVGGCMTRHALSSMLAPPSIRCSTRPIGSGPGVQPGPMATSVMRYQRSPLGRPSPPIGMSTSQRRKCTTKWMKSYRPSKRSSRHCEGVRAALHCMHRVVEHRYTVE